MKKILGFLGTITIAGSGMAGLVGNAPAPAKKEINYLQTNNLENLKREKRGFNDNISEIEASNDDLFPSFKPGLWEEIKENYNYYDYFNDFKIWFRNRMNNGVWLDNRIKNSDLEGIALNIWNNWSTYNNLWENSDQQHRIRIKIAWDRNYSYRSASIRTDENRSTWNPKGNRKVTIGSCIGNSYLEAMRESAIGAGIGGASGATLGSIAPGPGTVAGGLGGALTGSIGGGIRGWQNGINQNCYN